MIELTIPQHYLQGQGLRRCSSLKESEQKTFEDLSILPWFLNSYLLIPASYLTYLVVGLLARFLPLTSKYFSKTFPEFWLPSIAICLIAIFAMYIAGRSFFLLKREFRWIILSFSVLFGFLGSLSVSGLLAVIVQVGVVLVVAKFWRYERSILCGALIGSIICFLLLNSGGIPLLNPELRAAISSSPLRAGFQVSSIFAAAYSSSKYGKRGFLFLLPLSAMAILLGYKGNLASIVIASLIASMISADVGIGEAFSISSTLIIVILLMGTFIAKLSYGSWTIPSSYYLLYRTGLSLHVFQELARVSFPLGLTYGLAMLDPTKKVIAKVIETPREVGITATLIGPATLDFGLLGAISLSVLLGIFMRAMHPSERSIIQVALYSASIARIMTLLDIGVGFVDLSYLLFLLYLTLEVRKRS